RNTQNGRPSQPTGHVSPMDTANEFANPPLFLRGDLLAKVTAILIRNWSRSVDETNKDLRRRQCVLHCRQPPSVKIAQMVNVLIRVKLKSGRLKFLQETAKWTSGFIEHFQNRLIENQLFFSHQSISPITEPPHTATSPRRRLLT